MKDQVDLDVTAAPVQAIEAIGHFSDQLLSLGAAAGDVVAAASEYADVPLLQAYAATFFLFGQTHAAQEQAAVYLERATRLQARCNPREALYLRATAAWARGDHEATLDQLEALCRQWPRDMVAAKVAEFHYYCAGQWWTARRFLQLVEEIAPDNARQPHFLAMRSFAHELAGDRETALRIADAALAIEPATPWAHHSLAHIYLMNGDLETGIRRLSRERAGWRRFGRLAQSHNAWHLALFHLERLELDRVLEIYREDVWGYSPDMVTEQLDAISLLWRLDLADHPQDAAWAEIAAHVIPRAEECFIPFITAHFVYALGRAGATDALHAALDGARQFATRQHGERARAWSTVGLPLLEGCAALALGDAAGCTAALGPVLKEIGRVGGSDAQDAMFLETYLVALMRSGEHAAARAYLETLPGPRRVPSPMAAHWRSRCGDRATG